MGIFLACLYGVFALVAVSNLLLMRRPPKVGIEGKVCVLIPARDEEANLRRLIPSLLEPNPGLKVYVFDDESSDATGAVAEENGAIVIQPREPLPKGWTGKNRACHELAKAALEDSDADWFLFLDADVTPQPAFIRRMSALASSVRAGVVTGFPTVVPGRGVEPLFLAWVGWILLSGNPHGLISRLGIGHSKFTNGQVHMWRRSVYAEHWPNEALRGRVMEDVMMGRLMARKGVRVEVANLSGILAVKMYETWRETLDGMSKNSYEATNTDWGTIGIALFFLLVAWGWAFAGPWALGLFVLNGSAVGLICRAPLWPVLLMPLVPTIGAYTMIRSLIWRKTGKVVWKGRTYP